MQQEKIETVKSFPSFFTQPVLVVLLLAMVLLGLLASGATLAHSTTTPQHPSILKPVPNCRVVSVILHGTQAPTIKCLQSTSSNKGALHPLTFAMNCNGSENLDLINAYVTYCFGGSGYIGTYLEDINEYFYTYNNGNDGWLRYYNGGPGYWQNMSRGDDGRFPGPPNNALVTQICLDCGDHS